MTRGLRRSPPPLPVAPPPECVYYEATAKTEVVAGTTDRSRELRGIVLQVRERRATAEAAAKATAREILTEDAPIEDRIARLAEIIFAAEYGGWDEIR